MATPSPHGRPLDRQSAEERAEQLRVLAEPLNLRVLSAMATDPEGLRDADRVAYELREQPADVEAAMRDLQAALLVVAARAGGLELTAQAWVRYGRLLGSGEEALPPVTPGLAGAESAVGDVPPVIERIAVDLAYRYSAYFARETVRRYVVESYELLKQRAKVTRHLASLTGRYARERLSALVSANGLTLRGTPEVLFVCTQNAGRSQMAAAILRYLLGDHVHVRTAGTRPGSRIPDDIVDALDEIGVPIATEFPKPLTDEVVRAADYVITMGCGDACPIYPGRRYLDWDLRDPVGQPMDVIRSVRDDVWSRVSGLIDDMGPLTADWESR